MSSLSSRKEVLRSRLAASRADFTDVGFSLLLTGLGIVGFDAAFGGSEAFTVGLPAVACGVAVGYLAAKLRLPLLAGTAAGILGFFLLGGAIALRPDAMAGFVPTPAVWSGLVDGAINGWVRLVTSVPPAGEAGNLLAIPYLAGYAGGLLTVATALVVRRWPVCILPPAGVLALSLLFGVNEPASLLLQGAVFGAVTVAWLSLRANRAGRPTVTHGSTARLAGGAALLGVAVVGAFVVGPRLPMADSNPRYVIREHIEPPFDPSQYPSPLSRFRQFDGKEGVKIEDPLLVVEGLPAGALVRIAVMDDYDGYVWRASSPGSAIGGSYQRVGDEIPGARDGERVTVRFKMGALAERESVWVPTVGSPTAIRFLGDRARDLRESFRFNRLAESAASPMALVEGDRWEVEANLADTPAPEELAELQAASIEVTAPVGFQENTALVELVNGWLADGGAESASPYEKITAIAGRLAHDGAHNNGSDSKHRIASGHSLARLVPFLTGPQPQGNDEQFAAAVAYLGRGIGLPTRVALVASTPEAKDSFEVMAEDVDARVEIALDGVGWVTLPDIEPQAELESVQAKEQPKDSESVQPPPPDKETPPASIPEEPESEDSDAQDAAERAGGSGILGTILRIATVVGIPLVLLLGPALLVVGLKARRRRRRRSRRRPADRIAGAWEEIVDLARDLGTPVPAKATRREISRFASTSAVAPLAEQIDAAVFGHADPDLATADGLWQQVDTVRTAMLTDRSRADRIRAAVSLTSLRAAR